VKKTSTTPYLAVIVCLLFLVGSVESSAQTHTQRQTPAAAALVVKGYWEYLPPGYATGSNFPCIIFLHGSGERGVGTPSDLNKILGNGPPKHIKNGHTMCFTVNGKTECFVVLSPQTGKWSWKSDVVPFVRWAITQYKVDPDRIYCSGLSMGGEGTWFSACFPDNEPNLWAALGVMCGRASRTDGGVVQNRKIAVWAFHGDADTSIGINAGLNPILGMRTAGGNPIWTVYPGVGHGGCWDRGYRTDHTYHNPNLYEWFLSIKRNNPGPKPPVVNAGTDITITLPVSNTTLTGTATDPDGTVASTQWTFVSGPLTITPASPSALSTAISGLTTAGTYTFALKATDDTGLETTDQVSVIVRPEPPKFPPVANAGTDKTITAPTSTISLTGSGTDSDGTIKPNPNGYKWTQNSGPNTAGFTPGSDTNPTINYTGLIPGAYTFTLTVTDNDNLTGSDQVVVTVLPEPPNAAPDANAGPDRTITLPGTTTTNLAGSGTDSDGTIATYAWVLEPGAPGTVTFSSQSTAATTISGLTTAGVYIFTFTVTDDKGLTDNDQVIVTVLPPPPNNLPVANAGPDITITLPLNQVTLTGSGSDSDGTIASYSWILTSDPVPATPPTIVSPNTAATDVTSLKEGNYVFTLTVTDDDGAPKSDQVIVKVLPVPPNDPPVANAGPDINITAPAATTTLNGSGTDSDGTIASYAWKKLSGTGSAITSPASAVTNITGLAVGTYTFELTVTDDKGVKGSDQVTVNVFPAANIPPVANAGADFSVTLPAANAALTGAGTDSDGTIATYGWELVSGPAAITFSNAAAQSPTVSPLAAGIYIFTLTVTDDDGAKGTDQVQLTVAPEPPNVPPVANAGADVTLTLPADQTTLTGSGTDTDGTVVSYHWNFLAGPAGITLGDVDVAALTIDVNQTPGTYSFELIISDNRGATATDEVKVFVNAQNLAPIVSAGPDKTITKPTNTTSLNGTSSDPDGTIVTREWSLLSAPAGITVVPTISSPTSNTTNVTNFQLPGVYVYAFTVKDDDDVSSSDQVSVTVNPEPPNTPPVANAGPNLEITLPTNSVSITGSGTDSDGSITSYQWSQLPGNPNVATATPAAMNTAPVVFSNLIAGTYIFRLTVTDNKGAKGQQDVSVKVNPQPVNIPPVANAGSDMPITLPVNSATLNGTGSDTDGTISNYAWTVINEPPGNGDAATFTPSTSPTTGTTNVSNLNTEGIYVFRLTVTDDDGVTSFDEVKITVNPIPANLPPIANGGGNKVLTVPTSTTTLSGSGSDTDGTIEDYTWTQRSSSNGDIANMNGSENTATLNLSSLEEGIYLFRLTVTDDDGSTGFDEVNVRVQPVPANQPPTANTGGNKIITQPSTTVSFVGSGTDPDGSITTYAWTQVGGPASTIGPPTDNATANISGLNNLDTYIFRLTVTDNQGAQGFDEVNVRVNPEPPNAPPLADAGSDQEIVIVTPPTTSVTLDASASTDSDGTIASYAWSTEAGSPSNPGPITGSATPTINGLVAGIYTFKVTVTDNEGESAEDYVQITITPAPANNPPVVDAGPDQLLSLPSTGPATVSNSVSATASDSDGTVNQYLWTVTPTGGVTIATPASSASTVDFTAAGTFVFTITVTDDDGETSIDQLTVTINANQPPVAFAGGTINVVLPVDNVTLAGSGSDADGTIVDYEWVRISPTAPGSENATAVPGELELDGLALGQYVYELTVTDDKGATATDQVTIDVTAEPTNQLPIADAGGDAMIILPDNSVTLDGLPSSDPDGVVTAFAWEQISGPVATLSDTTFAELLVTDLSEGVYVFALTVTDNDGATQTDMITVTVTTEEELNIMPKVFTPNGDDIGETWTWPANILAQYDGCELTIYSRFGKKVFEMVSYDNSWNGVSSNGVKLEDDAYYYVIKCSDGHQTTGGVRIVR
jgi:gliding motility-associated-like protein